jgi:hypothetical protein
MTRSWWMQMTSIRAAVSVAALVLFAGCERAAAVDEAPLPDGTASSGAQTCRVVSRSVALPDDMNESSGAALDPRAPGVFWTHGDSGADPVLFAVDVQGRLVGRVVVSGARNRDWEDMAIGPCPGGDCVYVADIGNNRPGSRNELVLYRVPLPQPTDSATRPAEVFRARFPGGGRDSEALFVNADGGVYLVNKGQRDDIELWRWPTPLQAGPVDLVRVRVLAPEPEQPGDAVTGAAASRDGRWVALRTYGRLVLYRTVDLLGSGAPAFSMDLAPLGEPQGEGVAVRADGTVLLTSESGEGALPGRAAWLQCPLE